MAGLFLALTLAGAVAAEPAAPPTTPGAQVVLETRLLSLSAVADEQFVPLPESGIAFLSPEQAAGLLKRLNDGSRDVSMLQLPRMTVESGQAATVNVSDPLHCVTGLKLAVEHGRIVPQPQEESFDTGIRFAAWPTVSADRRFVRLPLVVSLTRQSAEMPPVPVSVPAADGAPAATVALQIPKIETLHASQSVSLPDGNSVLFRLSSPKARPPVLGGKAPYVKRTGAEMVVMVTARVTTDAENDEPDVRTGVVVSAQEESEQPPTPPAPAPMPPVPPAPAPMPPAPPAPDTKKLHALLANYYRACAEGRTGDARELAVRCLAIDPTCFGTGSY
jgi:hypothetical protein